MAWLTRFHSALRPRSSIGLRSFIWAGRSERSAPQQARTRRGAHHDRAVEDKTQVDAHREDLGARREQAHPAHAEATARTLWAATSSPLAARAAHRDFGVVQCELEHALALERALILKKLLCTTR